MIRVKKRDEAPEELEGKGYTDDSVKRAILEDQDDKCYLCERKVTTDYEVEHLASQSNNADMINQWGNLYIACGYCNRKKQNLFDDIKHPDKYNVEDEIVHGFDPMSDHVEFKTSSTDPGIVKTVKLLDRLFNGNNAPMRNLKENRFYEEFKMNYNFFQNVVHDYLAGHTEEMRPVITELIGRKNNYLAFKYAVIMQNEILRHDFGELVVWNKQ